jgi:hypothetical protein
MVNKCYAARGWDNSARLFFGIAIIAMLERYASAQQARELPPDIAVPRFCALRIFLSWPVVAAYRWSVRAF